MVADGRLEEWPDAASAYARLNAHPEPAASLAPPVTTLAAPADSERQLERLCELEQLLAEDLARKPRHQKLASQQAWREELASLSRALGITA